MSYSPEHTNNQPIPKSAPGPGEREQLQAILHSLRREIYNQLRTRRIDSLKTFLSLSEEELLTWRNCGTGTAAQIVAAQTSVRTLIALSQQSGRRTGLMRFS